MNKIEKALAKLSVKERQCVQRILASLAGGNIAGLNIKKLKGRDDILRVRKGDIRIIYRIDEKGAIFVLSVQRRKEDTYRLPD